jgi:hypothetical protein
VIASRLAVVTSRNSMPMPTGAPRIFLPSLDHRTMPRACTPWAYPGMAKSNSTTVPSSKGIDVSTKTPPRETFRIRRRITVSVSLVVRIRVTQLALSRL